MGITLSTNETANHSSRYLNDTSSKMNTSEKKVSTGLRVNVASDDAAALSISENERATIRSLGATQRNTGDAISVVQVAEGAMSEVSNMLIRMRELAVYSSSDTISNSERELLQKEYSQLKDENYRISKTTTYNGLSLLDGSQDKLTFQVGVNSSPNDNQIGFDREALNISPVALGYAGTLIISKQDARNGLTPLDLAITSLQERRSNLGALQSRLQSTLTNTGLYKENQTAGKSRLVDSDMADETAEYTKQKIAFSANIAVAGQANNKGSQILKLLE